MKKLFGFLVLLGYLVMIPVSYQEIKRQCQEKWPLTKGAKWTYGDRVECIFGAICWPVMLPMHSLLCTDYLEQEANW